MRPWFRHIILLTATLLVYYAVTFVVIYLTVTTPSVAASLIANGQSLEATMGQLIMALFPIPFFLWLIGVVLSKWIAF
ncbi:MAG: hypothetical protein WED05_10375 [Candidatus Atabeyarchaeum deiterrae]|jgi:hypothetical protein